MSDSMSQGGLVYTTLLGQDFFIINNEEIMHELMERRSAVYASRPRLLLDELLGADFMTTSLPYGDRWRLHRKMFNVAFGKKESVEYKSLQIQKARQLLQNFTSSPQEFSASVIMAITYGYDTIPENDPFVSKLVRFVTIIVEVVTAERAAIFTAFPFLVYIPSWLPGGVYKQRAGESRALARQVLDDPVNYVKQSIVTDSARMSLVRDLLLGRIRKGTEENHDVIIKEAGASAIMAGTETHTQTFSTILIFILAITLHPEVQTKAQEEIDRVVGNDRLPDFSDMEHLPYVEAICLETLRWCPIAPLLADDVYDGMYIPKGSNVLINVWAMAQNEERFPDPTLFKPERYLTLDGKVVEDTSTPLLIFGLGRRICPGKYVAMQSLWAVMVSILATLYIGKAKDEFGNEIDFEPEFTTGVTRYPKPFPCTITPRSSRAEELIRGAAANNST
ncbi:hypothetical protein ID866_4517 [Astraeus odoratus]|nr:hypothetical protein ID866_4517 [Astraeus odoratus]